MESDFQTLKKQWTEMVLTLENFSQTSTGVRAEACSLPKRTVADLEFHLAKIQMDLVTLSEMLNSPLSADFRTELVDWLQLMQKLDNVLHLFQRLQQVWRFLTKVLNNPSFCISQTDVLMLLHPVDKTFQQVIQHISSDPRVLSLISSNHSLLGDDFCQILSLRLSTVYADPMMVLLDSVRGQYARLRFLSDRELVEMFSCVPSPSTMVRFVRRLFTGVQELQAAAVQDDATCTYSQVALNVWGVYGSFQEHIPFMSPVEPTPDAAMWLHDFNQQMQLSMVEHMRVCSTLMEQLGPPMEVVSVDKRLGEMQLCNEVMKQTLNILVLLATHPTQCLLVTEEAMWCKVLARAFIHQIKMNNLKFYQKTRVSVLGRLIRDRMAQEKVCGVTPACVRRFLKALVHITMNHSEQISQLQKVEGHLHSSFEWLSSMKYNLSVHDSQEPLCSVDVLNQRLQYGYEYVGSVNWIIPKMASTDRAKLGILLALTNFRSGFVCSPCKISKRSLIVQIAMALGRVTFVLECDSTVRLATVQNYLLGSLQMGAWILLDSADLLSDKVSTTVGQFLIDIHQSFAREKVTQVSSSSMYPMCNIRLADKEIQASYNYGCLLVSSGVQDFQEDLHVASRPVALAHPDYKVIAEVMLTSLGFIDAKCLSQRLVSIIMLANKCLCLPGYKTKNDNCVFLVLQNIITSSEPFLEQCRKQRNLSEENSVVFTVVHGLMEEAAVVKSILSVLLPWTHELNKVLEFQKILKDIFPIVCQFPSLEHYLEEQEQTEIKAAIMEELQTHHLQPEIELINNAMTIYQNLKYGKAVILSGLSGSGKTSCYSVLAGAMNLLAAKSDKNNTALSRFVKPVVLFPNSMSLKELIGHDCEWKSWQDGALMAFLRSCGQVEGVVNWLILDGETQGSQAGELSWVDTIVELSHFPSSFLGMTLGEQLMPPQEHLQFLLEVTDLSTASPSALIACSLVHFTGMDLWRAVWGSQKNKIYSKHHLDKAVVEMWELLAEDLFPATLEGMSPGKDPEARSSRRSPEGLQEVMSFCRILTALVQHYEVYLTANNAEDSEVPDRRGSTLHGSSTTCTIPENRARVLARNCFLIAYSWGFGGHLHSSFWPRFQSIAQEVLWKCRYQIRIPEGESVFEYFFTSDSCVRLQTTTLMGHISPKYGVYKHLLYILLKAKQPVLLAGEPGSGKSTLCRGALSFQEPSVPLSGSALLSPAVLFSVFWSCHTARASNLLLFVDDLHLAADATRNTSQALEVLRQSVGTGTVRFNQSSLQFLSTTAISYLCTISVSPILSVRLIRLFTVLMLPSLTPEVLSSLYSPDLELWMPPFVQNSSQMASCIISATHSLYLTLQEHFKYTFNTNSFLFSIRDVPKVFQGMTLWKSDDESIRQVFSPGGTKLLCIVKLWLHECMHTFIDRVFNEDQHTALESIMANIGTVHFGNMLEESNKMCSENSSSSDAHLTTDGLHMFILEYIKNIRSKVVYCPDVSELLNQQQKTFERILYKEYSLENLTEAFYGFLNTQTDTDPHSVRTGFLHMYAVHQPRARQLAHIFRLLLIPGAHAALLASESGTGRKSTVRCAALLSGCDLLELHSANQMELWAMLKEASDRSRVRGTRVMLLVHEDVNLEVREHLLEIMAQSGSRWHTQQQLTKHISTMTSTSSSQRYKLDHWMLERFLSQMHKNIHIFLLLPNFRKPSSQWDTQMSRAVWRSCCVEVYRSWSHQTLVSTAVCCLQSCRNGAFIGESVGSVAETMAHVHLSAHQYALTQLTFQPFTPSTYLQFIDYFIDVYQLLHKRTLQHANRAAAVVSRLEKMSRMTLQKVNKLKEKIQQTQQEEQVVLGAITEQEQRLHDVLDMSAHEESRLIQLERDIQHIQLQVQAVQEAGVRKVSSLELSALAEVRGYRDPPEPVVTVLDAVCLLFQRPPGWDNAKHLLSQDNFFQKLEYFDHCSITKQQLHQLGALVNRADFNPLVVREASLACESLCHWVLAVYECCRSQQHRQRGRTLEFQTAQSQETLRQSRWQKTEALKCLKTLQSQLHSLQEQRRKWTAELQQAEDYHQQSVAKLEPYAPVWKQHAQAAVSLEALPGDALLTAAILSYLGPFGADTRSELVSTWTDLCVRRRFCGGLECTPPPGPPLPVSTPFQGPSARVLGVSERRLQEVDSSSLLVLLLLWKCTRNRLQPFPLLVDPHHRLDINPNSCSFIGEQTKALQEFEVQLYADDPDMLERLEQAQATGARVLVRDAERVPLCSRLLSLLSTLSQHEHVLSQTYPPSFCLVFCTTVPVHRLTTEMPEPLLRKLCVVDLTLGSEEMESFIQTQLLFPESSALLRKRCRLQQSKQQLTEQLISRELSIMDNIAQREGPLLGDSHFADRAHVFLKESEELQRELEQVEDALQSYSKILRCSQPLFALMVNIYRALQQVAVLSPAYCFSLEGFLCVLKGILSERVSELASYSFVPGMVIEELSQQVISTVLMCYVPCLFKSHAPVLRVLLCVALLQHRQLCSVTESQGFLHGLHSSDQTFCQTCFLNCPQKCTCSKDPPESCPETCPDWIPAHVRPQLWRLEKLPSFRGLLSSLSAAPKQWQEYLRVPSSVMGRVPVSPFTELSLLQRALLWRTLKPESLQYVAEHVAGCLLTEPPPCGSPEALSQLLLLYRGPVILSSACCTGTQPLQLITRLALRQQVSLKVITSCEQASIVSALKGAPKEGVWLVFKSSHLLGRWERQLLAEFNMLILSLKGSVDTPRLSRLQLWFIVPEEKIHLIPFVGRVQSLVFICDSSRSLTEEVSRSLQLLAPQLLSQSEVHRGPLHSCALFHSVLLQRQFAQSYRYHWTDTDLLVLVEAYFGIGAMCSDPMEALEFLTVRLVHGGQVLDVADLEELRCVAFTYLLSGLHNHQDIPEGRDEDMTGRGEVQSLGFGEDIWKELLHINSHRLDNLLRMSQTPPGPSEVDMVRGSPPGHQDRAVSPLQRLSAVQAFMEDKLQKCKGAVSGPLQDFFQAEWDALWSTVTSWVTGICQSPRTQSQLEVLEKRSRLLTSYLWPQEGCCDPAQAYRLSAFTNPTGFLLAVRRHYAIMQQRNVSDTTLLFQVLGDTTLSSPNTRKIVYLCDLELRGGVMWDPEVGAICHSLSAGNSLPLLCVHPSSPSAGNPTPATAGNPTLSSANNPTLPSEDNPAPPALIYLCPLYVHPGGHSSLSVEEVEIARVPLQSRIQPEICEL